MDDLLSEFLTETNESLAVLDVELVKLEQNPNDPELLSNIFRLMHTIKGTCGFLGLAAGSRRWPMPERTCSARCGTGSSRSRREIVTLILECLDQIRAHSGVRSRKTRAEPDGDDSRADRPAQRPGRGRRSKSGRGEVLPDESPAADVEVAAAPAEPSSPRKRLRARRLASPRQELRRARQAAVPAQGAEAAPKESAVANQSIRVNVELLEDLMTMVSELVLTRNQLLQILRSQKRERVPAPLQRLNHVVSELQEGVMKTRMQPIGNAWAKLPRIVRDLSHELDKKIDLVMKGAETELDRQVLELIKDPLTHMVRNSADHGLEETGQERWPASRRPARCCSTPSTRAATSSSRSPTTAAACRPTRSSRRRSRTGLASKRELDDARISRSSSISSSPASPPPSR